MKYIIPGINIKVFARAIHALARIGDELYIEPEKEGLSFRTVNSSRSAFASFFFQSKFFSHFDTPASCGNEGDDVKCKVAMKACLNAFKSIATVERSIERCRLIFEPNEDRLVVNLICKHGINKTYNLSFIDCETLQAMFDRQSCPFEIGSQSKVLSEAFINFHSSLEEVTLTAEPQKVVIKNYTEDEPDPAKAIHTELTMERIEFDLYQVSSVCEVTFCLKEVRSLLTFTEPLNIPVTLSFSDAGSPIIFSTTNNLSFEANFVLATLATNSPTQTNQSNKKTKNKNVNSMKSNTSQASERSMKRPSEIVTEPNQTVYNGDSSVEIRGNSNQNGFSPHVIDPVSNLFQSQNSPMERTFNSNMATYQSKAKSSLRTNYNTYQSSITNKAEDRCKSPETNRDCEDDIVPGTPPAKRRRFYFKRCFEPTFHSQNMPGYSNILAEDSDPGSD